MKNDTNKGLNNMPTYTPKDTLWPSIENKLDQEKKKRIIWWRIPMGIAASFLILFLVGQFFVPKKLSKNEIPPVNKQKNRQDKTPNTVINSSKDNNTKANVGLLANDSIIVDDQTSRVKPEIEIGKINTPSTIEIVPNRQRKDEVYQAIFKDQILLTTPSYSPTPSQTYSWSCGAGIMLDSEREGEEVRFTFDVSNVATARPWSLDYTVKSEANAASGYSGLFTTSTTANGKKAGRKGNRLFKKRNKIKHYDWLNPVEEIYEGTDKDGIVDLYDKDSNPFVAKNIPYDIADLEKGFPYNLDELTNPKIKIYNRFGNLVAESNTRNGILKSNSPVPDGTYYIIVSADDIEQFSSQITQIKGCKSEFELEFKNLTDTVSEEYSLLAYIENDYTESYARLIENKYKSPAQEPLSTFAIDVDNASYSIMRSKLNGNEPVPNNSVRIEEFINYFSYNYPKPTDGKPFSSSLEMATCPWNTKHKLVHIGLQGKTINYEKQEPSNLVFLLDVSGSMDEENKLPLVKKSMKLLVEKLGEKDKIAIVTYAGAAGLALRSTSCSKKDFINKKIKKLDAGGSTAGGEGIELAYKVALDNLIKGGNNRVILCTDGDFNVGESSDAAMKELIQTYRDKGVFITVCGYGMGNLQDSKMETIADNGNGNYFYIDNFKEASKVFDRELLATLFTIAKDVKIQVEFNPAHVKAYRLIGYENRIMPAQDFADDTKDGGELGAGHTVTAIYEIIPASSDEKIEDIPKLKYQKPQGQKNQNTNFKDEVVSVKLRYKTPNGTKSNLQVFSLNWNNQSFDNSSQIFQFSAGVALFASQLRASNYVPQDEFRMAKNILKSAKGQDINGDRQELLNLITKAKNIYFLLGKE